MLKHTCTHLRPSWKKAVASRNELRANVSLVVMPTIGFVRLNGSLLENTAITLGRLAALVAAPAALLLSVIIPSVAAAARNL